MALPAWSVCAALSLVLIGCSQAGAVYDGDEGLHEIAIALVRAGKRPYLDFFYWHEPLYLYLAAGWTTLVGHGWRSLHLLSALGSAATTWIVAATAMRALPDRWRNIGGTSAAVFFAGNLLVIKWGTITHNYAAALLCLALAVAFALRAIEASSARPWIVSGLFTGAAAASTPLNAPVLPLIAAWLAWNGKAQPRLRLAAFLGAAALPFLPLVWLTSMSPWHPWFGLVTHHLYLRASGEFRDELNVPSLAEMATSPQVIVIAGLVLYAIVAGRRRDARPAERRLVSLTASLVIVTALFTAIVRPPAQAQYYTVLAPAAALAAAAGVVAACRRWRAQGSAWFTAAALASLFLAALVTSIYRQHLWISTRTEIDALAAEVNRVTPSSASFYSPYWFVYSAAERVPPAGFENESVSRIDYPAQVRARLPFVSQAEIIRRVGGGEFDTVLLVRDDPRFDAADLDRHYANRAELGRGWILRWNRR